jgi:hypothetical protein
MGMGLSICRSIVEAHDGRISVRPNDPKGTIFEVSLPLHMKDERIQQSGSPSSLWPRDEPGLDRLQRPSV